MNIETTKMLETVYRFIAELNGYKSGTVSGKTQFGKECYANRTLPELSDDSTHEIIWLERLYDITMRFHMHLAEGGEPRAFHWDVPIELDASASMLGYAGVLLADRRLLEMVNLLGDADALVDPWEIEGLSRAKVKAAATPKLYGSSKSAAELWTKKKLSYTLDELQLINKELSDGALGLANKLKDFLISQCQPKAVMNIKIGDDEFTIRCNRYRNKGEATKSYDLYDSSTKTIRTIRHTSTVRVPDLEQFRRFFPTGLIHNLDSQVADHVTLKTIEKYGFCISIHDAFLVSPWAAEDVRKWYAEEMFKIYENREGILRGYFTSIGIPLGTAEWNKVLSKVVPITEEITEFRGEVLK